MKKSHIAMAILALISAAVLFVTYGTVLPAAPFATIPLDGPTAVDSNGKMTVVADSGSRRALIMNADGDLTGVVSCTTADSPFNAITHVCVSGDLVFISGVKFEPDSDVVSQERVAAYDKGGNYQGLLYEGDGSGTTSPSIKSLSDATDGVVVAFEKDRKKEQASKESAGSADGRTADSDEDASLNADLYVSFDFVNDDGMRTIETVNIGSEGVHDAAYSTGSNDRYAILNTFGQLLDSVPKHLSQAYEGHVFTSIDVSEDGALYACDDTSGSVCVIPVESTEVRELIQGDGYDSVHENAGVLSMCVTKANEVLICDTSGQTLFTFRDVSPSIGFSARMLLVWACALYLVALAIIYAVRKLKRLVNEGKTEGIGPMLMVVAVVIAVGVAIGSLSFSSYQSSLETRAREINMCATYLESDVTKLSTAMANINDRSKLRGKDEQPNDAVTSLLEVATPALLLVGSADASGIGMYCTLYGKDSKGIFYIFGTSEEYVMGTSAQMSGINGLEAAFTGDKSNEGKLLQGRTLRDTTQYRLVSIPTPDGAGTAGVIEIGSKSRSFESSVAGDLARNVLALLVLMLVVYLAYTELRACGHCLFSYRQRQSGNRVGPIAELTRPFTLAITMLTSIDSVMTVLIAREMLTSAGMGGSSPLLALPAVMLGVGMVVGQALFGAFGSRVGLRKLMAGGAFAMLLCAAFTALSVMSGLFWLYCGAKLAMAVPFGLLYSLGYSLPRLAQNDDERAIAAGGVKRTDTSAAALGTVLGGYAAQSLGNVWVYALVGGAALVLVIMALNLLPRNIGPLETLAQKDLKNGNLGKFVRSRSALAIAFLVILPSTVAAGYSSLMFPLFSDDLGLAKSDINNIVVLGQLIVFICINSLDRIEERYGKIKVATISVALLGVVFLLFSVNATLAWSIAVIALIGVFCKASNAWKGLWLDAASKADVSEGRATGAMFSVRSLALVAQPFILGGLLGVSSGIAFIVIGAFCVVCAGLFVLLTRK